MLTLIRNLCLGCALMMASAAHAELVVIVSQQNDVNELTRTQIINIFLGNHRQFPNGLRAQPVDLPVTMPEKAAFYRALVNKDLDQMAAYWSRLVFAGNTSPPIQASSLQKATQKLASDASAITYVERRDVNPSRFKIVFTFPE